MKETIPALLKEIKDKYPDLPARYSKDNNDEFQSTSFTEFYEEVGFCALGFLKNGIKRNDHIGLISENRKEWFISDLGLLCIGATDVPRGCDSMTDEIRYILDFGDCKTVIVEDKVQFEKILSVEVQLPKLKKVIIIDKDFDKSEYRKKTKLKLISFEEIMTDGRKLAKSKPNLFEEEIDKGKGDDVATIIFTSGTTGEPKGVMLSHINFLHQVKHVPELISVVPGDKWLCVLPVWHSFERIMQYVALGTASSLCYSKPIGPIMLNDFQSLSPAWMASVPRIWESLMNGIYRNVNSQGGIKKIMFHSFVKIGSTHSKLSNMIKGRVAEYHKRSRIIDFTLAVIPYLLLLPLRLLGDALVFKKIKTKLGGKFVAGISGGGALPRAVDNFFAAAGILLLEGYGLTETAPVLALRVEKHPVPGTIGPIFPGTEFKILNSEKKELGYGEMGVLHAKGPQVMLGYYKKEDLTKEIIDEEGFINTGDLCMKTCKGEIKIMGREKDTIVLLGGENIEPAPIEEKLQESAFISTVVVLGQDKKFLSALIVVEMDNIQAFAEEHNISYMSQQELLETHEIIDLFNREINGLVSSKNEFKSFERIFRFKLLSDPFTVGRELSGKQEVKRHIVNKIYKKEIELLFK